MTVHTWVADVLKSDVGRVIDLVSRDLTRDSLFLVHVQVLEDASARVNQDVGHADESNSNNKAIEEAVLDKCLECR